MEEKRQIFREFPTQSVLSQTFVQIRDYDPLGCFEAVNLESTWLAQRS